MEGVANLVRPVSEGIGELQRAVSDPSQLHRIVISGRRKGHQPEFERIDLSPVLIKGEMKLQVVRHSGTQDFTENISAKELDFHDVLSQGFANILLEHGNERIEMKITKRGDLQIHRSRFEGGRSRDFGHDRKKDRMLSSEEPVFHLLGITSKEGEIFPSKSDKYIQVDQFLRILESTLDSRWKSSDEINVVDLGCGNAYLTFAAHRFLASKGFQVKSVGIDRKKESVLRNNEIAGKLGIDNEISFTHGDIADHVTSRADIVIALHACDTASDDAISWAFHAGASSILISPCCHHHLNKQITDRNLSDADRPLVEPLLRDGIVRERFADLLTDSIRAQVLRTLGYRTEIIEFVAGEHTSRNLMIRAVKKDGHDQIFREEFEQLQEVISHWKLEPYLCNVLAPEIKARRANLGLR